ncbi:MAG TPA: hypothetical protein VIH86_14560 [Puia sp.]|jgi:hypothetical protein
MGTNKRDLVVNVNFKDALIRFGITLLLPILALVIDSRMMIYTAPVMAYLFVSAIIHFCVFKYLWHRYIRHEPTPPRKPYGEDPNYPEESI